MDFSKARRLLVAGDYAAVFSNRLVASGRYMRLYRLSNDLPTSRLGIVVSKKVHKRANKRNYIKRQVRELFRNNHSAWHAHYDIVIHVLRVFTRLDYTRVKQEFMRLSSSL